MTPFRCSLGGWLLIKRVKIEKTASNFTETEASDYRSFSNYKSNTMLLNLVIMTKLREAMHFDQLRFYCFKKLVGRVFHVMTNRNPLGEAVVTFFTNSSVQPQACESYTPLPDDNSTLAKNCSQWGKGEKNKWGSSTRLGRYRLLSAPVVSDTIKFRIKVQASGSPRGFYCDENTKKSHPLSIDDEGKIFVH